MPRKSKVSRNDYCQFLLSSQTNFTLTYCAEHVAEISHDAYNSYLRRDKLTPSLVWEHASCEIIFSENGFIVFDDSVLDKSSAEAIELCRWQYSGNAKDVINGIGVVNAVYVNPETNQFWVFDYRIYAPDFDGKTKLDHLIDMLRNAIFQKSLLFKGVLMDAWYATHKIMLTIDEWKKLFYCPIKSNRLVSEVNQKYHHMPVENLQWDDDSLSSGKTIHINKFPNNFHVKLFRITMSSHRTDFVVTNDKAQLNLEAVQEVYGCRWKVEEFHREIKQITGVEKCQCRKHRIQRNHIACSYLVWLKLKSIAYKTKQTIYQLKQGLLKQYMINELKNPSIKFGFA